MLLVSVVLMAYFLGVAQDNAKKTIINQTGLSGLGTLPKPVDIPNLEKNNGTSNSTIKNNT
jgi:hypothetical protein